MATHTKETSSFTRFPFSENMNDYVILFIGIGLVLLPVMVVFAHIGTQNSEQLLPLPTVQQIPPTCGQVQFKTCIDAVMPASRDATVVTACMQSVTAACNISNPLPKGK